MTPETPSPLPDLVPARMVNEFAYCPRLAYLEWVEGEFADNVFTVDGRRVHRRVDEGGGVLPDMGDEEEAEGEAPETIHARSVLLSAPVEGLITRIDLVESRGREATPVDYKRGKKPDVAEGAYEPERVQLCVQGLVLRENGYESEGGVLYFKSSKERVEIPFDDSLVARTRELVRSLKDAAAGDRPPPLVDSPKCDGCSLAGICLPDETRLLTCADAGGAAEVRRLLPARDDALPFYVQSHGLRVGKSGELLTVKEKKSVVTEARLASTSQVSLFGNVQISAQALRVCCEREIPVCHFSAGGWFYGVTRGIGLRNAELKRLQFRTAERSDLSLLLARRLVWAKIQNQRTLLRRNHSDPPEKALSGLADLASAAEKAVEVESLLGIEGSAARIYFSNFGGMLKTESAEEGGLAFDFEGRNRRPPADPVNAMLSFLYSMLTKDWTVTLLAVGFEPFQGFYHRPRFGRPALSLDLMEEFRPLVADSVVLSTINTRGVSPGDFVRAAGSCAMKTRARKRLIEAYERRLDQLVTHPVFGYRISYRRVFEVQARLLARCLAGEIDDFPPFLTR